MKVDLRDPANWIPKEMFLAYCGEGSETLSKYYDKCVAKKNMMHMSLNWLSVLLFPAYTGYRRLWSIWATITIIFAGLPFVEALMSRSLPVTAFSGAMLAIGLMGNGLLLMQANAVFHKLKKQGLEIEEIRKRMRFQARPSTGLAFLALGAHVGLVILGAFLADITLGLPG
jgi:hypothetical protein